LSGDGSGGSSFATTIVVASLGSLVSAMQNEERKKEKQRGTKRKNLQLRALKKKEKRAPIPFQ
jgi:hypothetical protein